MEPSSECQQGILSWRSIPCVFVSQLRHVPAYMRLIDAAKVDGADLMATLLTHVGWNEPDGILSIHQSMKSAVGRKAFAAVGFPEAGPTGASIPEVLTRAGAWLSDHGHAGVAGEVQSFIDATWPDLAADEAFVTASDDALAESGDVDESEVEALRSQLLEGSFSVPDQFVTSRTRGSAQRVFARQVKRNYGWRCALTGITTREFLVASHIVPWSEDESIRLDPANGICLSTLVDRAFDTGHLVIHDDYTVHVDWDRVASDGYLRAALEPFQGRSLTLPSIAPPNPEFLKRRLADS